MDTETGPEASAGGAGEFRAKRPVAVSRWWRWLRRMPMRMRLVLAFVALIVSSATATILIGSTVFGQKIDELARESVGLYLKLGAQVFDVQLERLRMTAQSVAGSRDDAQLADQLARTAPSDVRVDFAVRFNGTASALLRRTADGLAPPAPPSARLAATLDAPFGALVRRCRGTAVPSAGLVVVPRSFAVELGLAVPPGDLLLEVAVAPMPGGPVLLLGRMLNGATDLLRRIEELVNPRDPKRFGATVFLGDVRIATIVGPAALHTHADPRVAEVVLRGGRQYTGLSRVVDDDYYASYVPLFDLDGRVIGMLGVGERLGEGSFADLRRRTVLLFSSLIAAGMIVGFVMTVLFSKWLVHPIRGLAAGMSRVAEGDLSHRVRIESSDELGRLARAFNMMVQAVKERDHKLREMTEDRLSSVEKQISIGRLAAGVAHEINNPLTAILSLSSLMLKKSGPEDPAREDLEIIVAETTRCRDIVKNLLDFARERPMAKRIVDIREVLTDTLRLTAKYEPMRRVEVSVRLPSFPLHVNGDPKLLQQVFTNLLTNAAEACEEGGRIEVAADEDSSGGQVQVQFKDDGRGIPKEHLPRIFEPFFTTKGSRRGTGLGLSVSLGIVRKHDGAVDVQSEEGAGTTVTVTLPRWEWV
ncbi:MAG: cache domain-containing protein [Acidobacteria bacterium]|nr:cache domain-containing protein [Acidobacteriota bacterium]